MNKDVISIILFDETMTLYSAEAFDHPMLNRMFKSQFQPVIANFNIKCKTWI